MAFCKWKETEIEPNVFQLECPACETVRIRKGNHPYFRRCRPDDAKPKRTNWSDLSNPERIERMSQFLREHGPATIPQARIYFNCDLVRSVLIYMAIKKMLLTDTREIDDGTIFSLPNSKKP
jgi:hypothetical protein